MEVEQNKTDEKRDKGFRHRAILGRESWRKSFYTIRSPLTGLILGSFGIPEGNRTGNTHTHTHTHKHNTCLTTGTSGEAAQTLPSISSDWGLGREVWAASLFFRARTGLNALRAIWVGWCDIATQTLGSPERQKEHFPQTALTLHSDPWCPHRTKDCALLKQRRASWLPFRTLPPQRQRGRCSTTRVRRQRATKCQPQRSHLPPNSEEAASC